MNVKKKPDIDMKNLGRNPFIVNSEIKARSLNLGKKVIIQTDEGINLPAGSVNSLQVIEEQIYTKLYHDTDFRDICLRLNERGLKLVMYILYQLPANDDYIWINNVHFQDKCGYNKKTDYVEAVMELIRYGIITTTIYDDVYFINPLIFFCGNRLKKYPDNIKIR